jgi:TonB family protein
MVFRIAVAAALGISGAGHAAEAPREPVGKWVAEYADDMCLLQREYGIAPAVLTLAFKPEPMSDSFTTYVFESGPKGKVGYTTATLGLGSAAPPIEKRTATYYAPRIDSRVTELSATREELNRAAASGMISIDAKERLRAAFQVPGLSNALAVLDDCVADLLASWGFSREQQAAMAKKPEPVQAFFKYVSGSDYPIDALKNEERGSNSARFHIDAAGDISDCRVVESSGSKALDAALCRVVRRVHYHPAVDKAGKPMESLGFVRFRWDICC